MSILCLATYIPFFPLAECEFLSLDRSSFYLHSLDIRRGFSGYFSFVGFPRVEAEERPGRAMIIGMERVRKMGVRLVRKR